MYGELGGGKTLDGGIVQHNRCSEYGSVLVAVTGELIQCAG